MFVLINYYRGWIKKRRGLYYRMNGMKYNAVQVTIVWLRKYIIQ